MLILFLFVIPLCRSCEFITVSEVVLGLFVSLLTHKTISWESALKFSSFLFQCLIAQGSSQFFSVTLVFLHTKNNILFPSDHFWNKVEATENKHSFRAQFQLNTKGSQEQHTMSRRHNLNCARFWQQLFSRHALSLASGHCFFQDRAHGHVAWIDCCYITSCIDSCLERTTDENPKPPGDHAPQKHLARYGAPFSVSWLFVIPPGENRENTWPLM